MGATAQAPSTGPSSARGPMGVVRTPLDARWARSTLAGEEWTRPDRGRRDDPARDTPVRVVRRRRPDGSSWNPSRRCAPDATGPQRRRRCRELAVPASRSSSAVVLILVDPVPVDPGRQAVRAAGRVPPGQDRTSRLVQGPGLVFLIPIVDRPVKVDLREQFIEVPSQTTITKDNAPINIDFLIYWRIVDPLKSVVNVAELRGRAPGRGDDDPARRHRRHPARRRALASATRSTRSCGRSSTRSPSAGAARSPASRSARSPRRATSRTR